MVASLVIVALLLLLTAFDVIRLQHEGWLVIITFDTDRLCLPVRKMIRIFRSDNSENKADARSRQRTPAYVPTPKNRVDGRRTNQG